MLDIKVLGPGCKNCLRLVYLCKEVAAENNWPVNIEKVSDINEYGNYGVMLTPESDDPGNAFRMFLQV